MQDLLKDHFVEQALEGKIGLSLTCSVCGAVWSSELPLIGSTDFERRKNAVLEAMEHHRMCTFCARPVCRNCFENVEDISLCVQCGQRLRKKDQTGINLVSKEENPLKKVTLCIHNSLMGVSIARSLKRAGGFDVSCVRTVKECAQINTDIVLMEAAYNTGATLEDCLQEARHLRQLQPMCKVIVLCDENSVPEIARQVTQAKKDGQIDDFVYSSVSESYLTAMLLAI